MSSEDKQGGEKIEVRWQASAEFRFWIHDPEGDGMIYFRSAEDRDAYSKQVIEGYLDDAWAEEVENVVAGEVTHVATKVNERKRPPDDQLDEDGLDGEGQYWPADVESSCNYELKPLPSASSSCADMDAVIDECRDAAHDAIHHAVERMDLCAFVKGHVDEALLALKGAPVQSGTATDSNEALSLLRQCSAAFDACTGPDDCCGEVGGGRSSWPMKHEIRDRVNAYLRSAVPESGRTVDKSGEYDADVFDSGRDSMADDVLEILNVYRDQFNEDERIEKVRALCREQLVSAPHKDQPEGK